MKRGNRFKSVRSAKASGPSALERQFAIQCAMSGLPDHEAEFVAIPGRKFRFDFAWTDHRLLVELHGATWTKGRHTRGGGFRRDREKMRLAQALGWTVYEFTSEDINDSTAINSVREYIENSSRPLTDTHNM